MIKSKLKAKNCNRGQLLRPSWVSSARGRKLWNNQLVDWSFIPSNCRRWWSQMKLKSKFLQIGQCHLQNSSQRTTGKIQNIMSLPRRGNCEQKKKTVPQKNRGQTMLKMSSIWDLKRSTALKILDNLNTMMQRTANENARMFLWSCYLGRHVTLMRKRYLMTKVTLTTSN